MGMRLPSLLITTFAMQAHCIRYTMSDVDIKALVQRICWPKTLEYTAFPTASTSGSIVNYGATQRTTPPRQETLLLSLLHHLYLLAQAKDDEPSRSFFMGESHVESHPFRLCNDKPSRHFHLPYLELIPVYFCDLHHTEEGSEGPGFMCSRSTRRSSYDIIRSYACLNASRCRRSSSTIYQKVARGPIRPRLRVARDISHKLFTF
jgi:hypothetical protein